MAAPAFDHLRLIIFNFFSHFALFPPSSACCFFLLCPSIWLNLLLFWLHTRSTCICKVILTFNFSIAPWFRSRFTLCVPTFGKIKLLLCLSCLVFVLFSPFARHFPPFPFACQLELCTCLPSLFVCLSLSLSLVSTFDAWLNFSQFFFFSFYYFFVDGCRFFSFRWLVDLLPGRILILVHKMQLLTLKWTLVFKRFSHPIWFTNYWSFLGD